MASKFELDIQRYVDKANGRIDLVVRKISLDLFRRVVMKSPVDTGRFKGNWQVQIGAVPGGTLKLDDKDGTATIARVTAETLKLKAGEVIYLVNNLEYARALEYGHSKQAPSGMVRITVAEFPQVVNKAAGETRDS
jgi:hypothetical protein